ncbi:MAG: cupin domain-containing protein [Chloroflexota bacterium]
MENFTLRSLIHPIDPDTFVSEYWEQKPLVITGRRPDYYANLFSRQDIPSLLFTEKHRGGETTITKFDKAIHALPVTELEDIAEVRRAYDRGYTLRIGNLDTSHGPLIQLCSQMREFFHGETNVIMFLTPPSAQGIGRHFDDYDLFLLQIDGAKQWNIYEPYVPLALREHMDSYPTPPNYQLISELRLTAGDLLYLPRGYVHEVFTTPGSSSLHLTLGVFGISWADFIEAALQAARYNDALLRRFIPPGSLRPGASRDRLPEQFQEMLAHFLSTASPDEAIEILRHRRKKWIAPAVGYDALFAEDNESYRVAPEAIGLDTILVKNRSFAYKVKRQGDKVSLSYGKWSVQAPADLEPVLQFVAEAEESFPVRALPYLTDSARLVLARRLVAEGLLFSEQ